MLTHSTFNAWIWACFTTLSVIGVFTNVIPLYWIKQVISKKNVPKSITILLVGDSVATLFSLFGFCAMCIYHLSTSENSENLSNHMKPSHYTFRCGLIFTSLYTPSLIGLVVTAGIATLRYIAIRSTIKNPINDNYAASLCTLILIALLTLIGIFTWFHLSNKLPLAIVSETCFLGENEPRNFKPATKLLPILPLYILLLISFIMNFLLLRNVRRKSGENNAILKCPNKNYEAIPLKATILSSCLFLPYLIIGAAVGAHAAYLKSIAGIVIGMVALLMNAIRLPITMGVTFSISKKKEPSIFYVNSKDP